MLDAFIIFAHSGVVLFSLQFAPVSSTPLTCLIKDVLLPRQYARQAVGYDSGEHTLRWLMPQDAPLVFVAVVSRAIAAQLKYIDALLASVKSVFLHHYRATLDDLPATIAPPPADERELGCTVDVFGFEPLFRGILDRVDSDTATSTPVTKADKRAARAGAAGAATSSPATSTPSALGSVSGSAGKPGAGAGAGAGADAGADAMEVDEVTAARTNLAARFAGRGGRGGAGGGSAGSGGARRIASAASMSAAAGSASPGGSPSLRKPLAPLPGVDFSYSKEKERELFRTASGIAPAESEATVERVEFRHDGSTGSDFLDASDLELIASATASATSSGDGSAGAAASTAGAVSSWFSKSKVGSLFARLTGNKVLERSDLESVVEELKSSLVAKNVAREVAESLCESLITSLLGRRFDLSTSLASIVTATLRDSIQRILTPGRVIDVLAEVRATKAAGAGPYVIVFVGVNGVGKSTTLSKVAYHLKDNHHSVLIAACDSFRAGAVEQLKRHCTALDIPLYQQGYAKDPVAIAAAAIRTAKADGTDVVLVDTAGRMQNNADLMAQLAKLVAVNKPDLVLFIGEALVGNDGVDQLCEFNRSLVDFAQDRAAPRCIDGIVLTKFDTIDDKVGATVSMVYKTGIPVVYLGTGQKYTDLRKLNVGAVVKALMS